MAIKKTLSDEELVVVVREQDREAFVTLVKRYEQPLLRYVDSIIWDADTAVDVVQESFIKAFRNLRSFDCKKKFSSWLYRIAHNCAIDHIKKEKQHISLDNYLGWLQIPGTEPEIEDIILQKEELAHLHAKLKQLPLKYREVLSLYYIAEKSYEEMSDILRLPTSTIGTQLRRAKQALRNEYAKK